MPRFALDRYTTFRDGSTSAVATEAAGVNKILLPPGEYIVDVESGVPTGTLPTCVVSFQEAADGATWVAATSSSITPSATVASTTSGYLKVTKQPNAGVTANVTAVVTIGGTLPVFPTLLVTAVSANRGRSNFNGLP